MPGATELWLFGETVGADAGAIDECIAAGLLTLRGDAVAFRHDLARRAVEDELSPVRRRELDRLVLGALAADGGRRSRAARPPRPPRGRRRGDPPPRARRRRAAASARGRPPAGARALGGGARGRGGRRPAAARGARGRRGRGATCAGDSSARTEARRALLAIHEAAGDALRVGDDLRWLSRLLWWSGRGEEAAALGDRSIAVLEAFPDSRELAMALSGRSQLAMLDERNDEAVALGTRAERARPTHSATTRPSPTR